MTADAPAPRRLAPRRVRTHMARALAAVAILCASCGGGGGIDFREVGENLRDGFAELERIYLKRSTVAFGGGRFVAVGPFGVFRSDEGSSYALEVSDLDTANVEVSERDISGVVYGDAGWIATRRPGVAFRSDDGIGWFSITLPTDATIHGGAFGAGTYVLVGTGGAVVVSSDTRSFAAVDSGTTSDLRAVVFARDRFVAVGANGTILASSDGLAWEPEASPVDATLFGIAEGDGVLVAAGAAGRLLRSADGAAWEELPSGIASDLYGVAFGLGRFVVVGENAAILVSEDAGATFANVGAPPTATDDVADFLSVTFGNDRFVAVGDFTAVSEDGFVW